MSKCLFFRESLDFLGHVVSAEGVQPDPQRVYVIENWPPQTGVHAVQQFLGLSKNFKHTGLCEAGSSFA